MKKKIDLKGVMPDLSLVLDMKSWLQKIRVNSLA